MLHTARSRRADRGRDEMPSKAPIPLAVAALGAAMGVSAIDNGLALSPPMGWSANNAWHWIYGQDVMEASCALPAICHPSL